MEQGFILKLMRAVPLFLVITWFSVALTSKSFAGNATILVRSANSQVGSEKLEAFVYLPVGIGPFPILILNHGSADGKPKRSLPWLREGAYWSQRGYIVVAPMRRGRGISTGVSSESEDRNCRISDWFDTLPQSLEDLDATIEFAERLPNAKPNAITLIGTSRGGFLSVAYAAEGRYKSHIQSVVNLVGGWVAQAEDRCPRDFNTVAFERYGEKTRTPMLWLYGSDDLFYGNTSVKDYVRTFKKAGGVADFHLIEGIPDNGHWLPDYPAKWQALVNGFLRSTNPI